MRSTNGDLKDSMDEVGCDQLGTREALQTKYVNTWMVTVLKAKPVMGARPQ